LLHLSIFFLNVYQERMSSVGRNASQIPANKLYINIASMINGIYDASGNVLDWCNGSEATTTIDLSTTGVVLLRDMGKTLYLPNPSAPSVLGSQSTILRKVQLIPSGVAGFYGTGAAATGSASAGSSGEYYTGYIPLGGLTYGGGTGIPAKVARLN
jgi:hypothetical protein